ncbi:cyclic nucleotide-binding domain containing protein [Stylonychia lemnae]|uniref:Cyclic nucleotide-binding domain containing protein n=1 Tax=Stylonychia lemnae TaxID=5949 RepID=A0A078AA35_STYLE|nr:cyclic nucleotide-binding domain containing protein [Stylonychia lemnae]|eukprot:CDW78417.1 cyclic nucleotide-binding domain containing protein [Stylonychia lemnae]
MASQILLQNLLGNEYNFQEIIKALKKNETDRSDEDIKLLSQITQVFFKDKGETEIMEITKQLHFEHFLKDDVVFEFGSQGDKYYLLIRGEVGVMVPCAINRNKSIASASGEFNKLFNTELCQFKELDVIQESEDVVSPPQGNMADINEQRALLNSQRSNKKSQLNLNINVNQVQAEQVQVLLERKKSIVPIPRGSTLRPANVRLNQNAQGIFKHHGKLHLISKTNPFKTAFEETFVFRSGQSFGELALMQNKPRSATILCLTDCYLASLNKVSFQNAIQKGMQRALNDNIEFLKTIPFFQGWTKNSLTKFLLHSVEIQKTVRNQVICREGENLNYVYFVKSGEFKAIQKGEIVEEKDDFIRMRVSHKNQPKSESSSSTRIVDPYKMNQISNARQLQNQVKLNVNNDICRYGVGQIFGEMEFLNKDKSILTVQCDTQQGELICVKLSEFQKKVKPNDSGFKMEQNKNILVNRGEQDYRETLTEIVKRYPFIERQKIKIFEIEKQQQEYFVEQKKAQLNQSVNTAPTNKHKKLRKDMNKTHLSNQITQDLIDYDKIAEANQCKFDDNPTHKSQIQVPKAPRATTMARHMQEVQNSPDQLKSSTNLLAKPIWITRKTLKACFSDRRAPTLESIVYDQLKKEKKCYMSSKLDTAVLDQFTSRNQQDENLRTDKQEFYLNHSLVTVKVRLKCLYPWNNKQVCLNFIYRNKFLILLRTFQSAICQDTDLRTVLQKIAR